MFVTIFLSSGTKYKSNPVGAPA